MIKKSLFVEGLFEAIKEVPGALADTFRRESLSAKMSRMGGLKPRQCYLGFYHLEKRKVLERTNYGYRFTEKGRQWVKRKKFNYFKWKNKGKNGQWRMVIFDIPQALHYKRLNFRKILKSWNFYQLQKSVFVFPFPCEAELAEVCGFLKITDYVDILTVSNLGFKEKEIRKYYRDVA